MPDRDFNYDHPTYTTMRVLPLSGAVAASGLQIGLTFRSNVKAVVTKIGVVIGSVSSATLILTALFNGSIMAILTLSNSANEVAREFTLSVNKTLDTILDRIEIHAAKDKGKVTVVYDYRSHVRPERSP
jgi:hypothetical protein